jgi:hypothetical protein
MCCAFVVLVFLGPRFFGAMWWLFQQARWALAFNNWPLGSLWWIWPILGLVFVPWTTIMYVIVAPGGVAGWDWLWIGLALAADIFWYAGGARRKAIPNYQGY